MTCSTSASPAARRDRRLHLRGPDAQLPGRRRHQRPSSRRRARGDPPGPMARLSDDGRRNHRAGLRVRGRRHHRARGEHPQHGHHRGALRRFRDDLARGPSSRSAGRCSSASSAAGAWVAVMLGATATAIELGDLGNRSVRDGPAGDARSARPDRRSARRVITMAAIAPSSCTARSDRRQRPDGPKSSAG